MRKKTPTLATCTICICCALALASGLSGCASSGSSSHTNATSTDTSLSVDDRPAPATNTTSAGDQSAPAAEATSASDQPAPASNATDTPDADALPTSAYINGFVTILQEPLQPSGCEVTSLTMVLNYWGYPCTNVELADNYLPYGVQGDNMFKVMIGSVYDDYALGCYAGAIVTCAENYAEATGATYTVTDISGASLEDYCRQIAAGHPLIVWGTENMSPSSGGIMWTVDGVETGYKYGEHCLVMIGYDIDRDIVVMADPLRGEVEYSLSTFYDRNQTMYGQAVLIEP